MRKSSAENGSSSSSRSEPVSSVRARRPAGACHQTAHWASCPPSRPDRPLPRSAAPASPSPRRQHRPGSPSADADCPPPSARERAGRAGACSRNTPAAVDGLPADLDVAPLAGQQLVDQPENGRFAAAGRPNEGHELPRRNVKGQTVNDVKILDLVLEGNVAKLEHLTSPCPRPCPRTAPQTASSPQDLDQSLKLSLGISGAERFHLLDQGAVGGRILVGRIALHPFAVERMLRRARIGADHPLGNVLVTDRAREHGRQDFGRAFLGRDRPHIGGVRLVLKRGLDVRGFRLRNA